MRILFITAFPPNKKTAGQNYTRQLLNDLGRYNKIDLIYWKYPDHNVDISDEVRILKAVEIKKFPLGPLVCSGIFPLFSKRYSRNIMKYLNNISHQYDLIYFDFSQVFYYAHKIRHSLKIGMAHDIIIQKYSRNRLLKYLLWWIKKSEATCLKSLTHVLTFSRKDSDLVMKDYGISSNTVSFYINSDILNIDVSKFSINNYYVMYGAWNRKENQESIHWLMKQRIHDRINIKIIGGGMPSSLIQRISQYSNMEYCGFIDDPYPIIAKSKGLIAPLFNGAGVKVKVVECLALGTPIIGSDVTFEGIDYVPFRNTGAMINLKDNDIDTSISVLDTISIEEKQNIRDYFMNNYNSSKFVDYLARISLIDSH